MSDILGRAAISAGSGFLAGGPIGALVGVATSLVPELIRAISGSGDAAKAAEAVAQAVQDVTGTSDPLEAASILSSNQGKLLEFRQKVLELQLQSEKNQQDAMLAALKESNADLQRSRETMIRLSENKHALAWMPAYKTLTVDLIFFGSVGGIFALVFFGIPDVPSGVRELLSLVFGVLVGEWRGSNQFWIGGSRAGALAAASAIPPQAAAPQAPASPAAPTRPSLFS